MHRHQQHLLELVRFLPVVAPLLRSQLAVHALQGAQLRHQLRRQRAQSAIAPSSAAGPASRDHTHVERSLLVVAPLVKVNA